MEDSRKLEPVFGEERTLVGAGLHNLGNTCYVNAVIQCLTHTKALVSNLRSLDHVTHGDSDKVFCALCALRDHIDASFKHSGSAISPSNIVDNLQRFQNAHHWVSDGPLTYISKNFVMNSQEDAHEFLQCLLERLADSSPMPKMIDNNSNSSQQNDLVNQVFGGCFINNLRCCGCGYSSDSKEPFVNLNLEIEDDENLSSILESFTKVERLEDHTCQKCEKLVPRDKQLKFDSVPSVATFHLKRFKTDGIHVEKVDKDVAFPLELDLQPYTRSIPGDHCELKYELYALVVHYGSSLDAGHYICFIRSSPNTWHKFDDAEVTMVDESVVLSERAYLLFYARQGEIYPIKAEISKETLARLQQPHYAVSEIKESKSRKAKKKPLKEAEASDTESVRDRAGAGLYNLGNTCYVNAVIQCLTHTEALVSNLRSLDHVTHGDSDKVFCALCALRDHIDASFKHSGSAISPSNIVNNLQYISKNFVMNRQEDAHEFLQCLLERLADSSPMPKKIDNNSNSSQQNDLVNQVFGGCFINNLRCCGCGYSSDSKEPFVNLNLEIEDDENLSSILESFTKVERLEDHTCQKCEKLVPRDKQLKFDSVPSVATFHLKRFKTDGIHVEKVDKDVAFPLELDLQPYTRSIPGDHCELKYELYALVVHYGSSLDAGHYICFIRSSPNTWHKFDDAEVTMVDESVVLSERAYLLFYARQGEIYPIKAEISKETLARLQQPHSAVSEIKESKSRKAKKKPLKEAEASDTESVRDRAKRRKIIKKLAKERVTLAPMVPSSSKKKVKRKHVEEVKQVNSSYDNIKHRINIDLTDMPTQLDDYVDDPDFWLADTFYYRWMEYFGLAEKILVGYTNKVKVVRVEKTNKQAPSVVRYISNKDYLKERTIILVPKIPKKEEENDNKAKRRRKEKEEKRNQEEDDDVECVEICIFTRVNKEKPLSLVYDLDRYYLRWFRGIDDIKYMFKNEGDGKPDTRELNFTTNYASMLGSNAFLSRKITLSAGNLMEYIVRLQTGQKLHLGVNVAAMILYFCEGGRFSWIRRLGLQLFSREYIETNKENLTELCRNWSSYSSMMFLAEVKDKSVYSRLEPYNTDPILEEVEDNTQLYKVLRIAMQDKEKKKP